MNAQPAVAFDATAFPRTYGVSAAGKSLLLILGGIIVAMALGGAVVFTSTNGNAAPGSGILLAICACFALLGLYMLAVAFLYRVVLKADSIQTFEVYRRREIARRDIEGVSRFWNRQAGTRAWVLVPKAGFGQTIKLSSFLKADSAFRAWMQSLPDLDAERSRSLAKERSHAIAALKERGFSDSAIERLAAFARGLTWAMYGFGLASFLISDPEHLLQWALIALPWASIVLVAIFTPFYRFGGAKNSPVPDLSLLLIIPGALLMLRVLRSMAPVGWHGPLVLTVLGSVILVGAALWVDPWLRQRRGAAVLLLILCCGYGYGAGLEVNALLDHSAAREYQVSVLGKHVSHGKSTSYHLRLAPWGPNATGQDLMVSASQYSQIKTGDRVCMLLRAGALDVGWSELGRCAGAF